jgi:regulator of RNase E activity RraA
MSLPPELAARLTALTTPHLADASLRVGIAPRILPAALRPAWAGARLLGRALPVRHVGSVDVYLDAFQYAEPGDVLVVDDDGRTDRACVGDLAALEAASAGISGILIWGLHRDSVELEQVGVPIVSLGSSPWGPLSVEPRPADALESASVGEVHITRGDVIVSDVDGVLALPAVALEAIVAAAEGIRLVEGAQADAIRAGRTLRDQVRFDDFVEKRATDADYTFRDHLRSVGGEIEI